MSIVRARGTVITLLVAAVLSMAVAGCGGGSQPASQPASAPAAQPAAPAESAPAAAPAAPAFDKLIIVDDVVLGTKNMPDAEKRDKACIATSRFLRNQHVVWRIKVIDPVTGEYLDDKAVGQVEVKLPDGQVFEAKYGPHPQKDPQDYYWTAAWEIPEDYPTGTVRYDIGATHKDGRTGQYVAFETGSALLTVLEGSVPKIAPKS